jgi:hypothetical protein
MLQRFSCFFVIWTKKLEEGREHKYLTSRQMWLEQSNHGSMSYEHMCVLVYKHLSNTFTSNLLSYVFTHPCSSNTCLHFVLSLLWYGSLRHVFSRDEWADPIHERSLTTVSISCAGFMHRQEVLFDKFAYGHLTSFIFVSLLSHVTQRSRYARWSPRTHE